ncbi:MAG: metal-dependent hydrolase [Chitinivibrionales bacterium]
MAGFKVHTVGGVFSALLVYGILLGIACIAELEPVMMFVAHRPTFLGLCALTVLCALFPDIDTNSVVHETVYGALVVVDIFLIVAKFYVAASVLGLVAMIPILGKHRGWTHSWFSCFLMPLPLLMIPVFTFGQPWWHGILWYGAAVAGYATHLAIDAVF